MAKRLTPREKASKRANAATRQFNKIVNYRVDGDSKTDIIRKFAKRWGMRTDSVQRYTSSPRSTRYRRIRDQTRQRSVKRIFNRMKREEEGFYYDLIIGRGEKLDVTKYVRPGIPDPPSDYPDVLGDLRYFKQDLKGNVWKPEVAIPRVLFRTPGKGKTRMGMIRGTFMVTLETNDPILGITDERFTVAGSAKQMGSTFGDMGDSELGIRKPAKDLYNVLNILIRDRYVLVDNNGYRILRIVFDPEVAKEIFPGDERAGGISITILNALAETKYVRNVAGEIQYRSGGKVRSELVPYREVSDRLKS